MSWINLKWNSFISGFGLAIAFVFSQDLLRIRSIQDLYHTFISTTTEQLHLRSASETCLLTTV